MSDGNRERKHNSEHDMALDAVVSKHVQIMGPHEGQSRIEILIGIERDVANHAAYSEADNLLATCHFVDRLSGLAWRINQAINSINDGRE